MKLLDFFKKQRKEPPKKINFIKTEKVYFKCKGELADNPDGKNRQDIINRILNNYKRDMDKSELYGGYTNKEILEMYNGCISEFEDESFDGDYEITTYKNKKSIIILLEDVDKKKYQVANIAKEDVEKFITIINSYEIWDFSIVVTGGNIKFSTLDNTIGKKKINYGIEVVITYVLDNQE